MGIDALHIAGQAGERAVERPAHRIQPRGERGILRAHPRIFLFHRPKLGLTLRVAQLQAFCQPFSPVGGKSASGLDQLFLVRVGQIAVCYVADRVVAQGTVSIPDGAARPGRRIAEVRPVLLLFPFLLDAGLIVDRLSHIVIGKIRPAGGDLLG